MIVQADRRLRTARREVRGGSNAYAVRSAQECAELSLKAALRALGIDYPKRHDVSRVLHEVKARLPPWFQTDIIVKENTWLAERREAAMYGSETSDAGAESLFNKNDAATALKYSEHIFKSCRRLVNSKSKR